MNDPYSQSTSVHYLPGRLRIKVPQIWRSPYRAWRLESLILSLEGILTVSANVYTSKVLILFDEKATKPEAVIGNVHQYSQEIANEKTGEIPHTYKQMRYPGTAATILLGGVLLKRAVFPGRMIGPDTLMPALSGAFTILSGYPQIREGYSHLNPGSPRQDTRVLQVVTLAALFFRQSILGLSTISLIGLITFWNRKRIAHHDRIFQHRAADVESLTAEYLPQGFVNPLLPLTICSSLVAFLLGGPTKALAILVIGCPCALTLGRDLPVGLGIGKLATKGILTNDKGVFDNDSLPKHSWFMMDNILANSRFTHIRSDVRATQRRNYSLVTAMQLASICGVLITSASLGFALSAHHLISLSVMTNSLVGQSEKSNRRVKSKKTPAPKEISLTTTDLKLGLSADQIQERLAIFGKNTLPDIKKVSFLQRLKLQCKGTMSVMMLTGTGVALLSGGLFDGLAIGGLFLINALLGVVQSGKAEKAADILKPISPERSLVLRSGKEDLILQEDLVPGDIVIVNPGDAIPADGFLLLEYELSVDESMLTGESEKALKHSEQNNPAPLWAGTTVLTGYGQMLVTKTGSHTQLGQISLMLQENMDRITPLQMSLENLAKTVLKIVVSLSIVITFLGIIRGISAKKMVLSGASLMAASVPQGLPTFVTIGLVAGVRELAKKKTVVRKLSALETMACVTCVCLDKTGTITQNRMVVTDIVTSQHFKVNGRITSLEGANIDFREDQDLTDLITCAVICNDAEITPDESGEYIVKGDSTEGALLVLAESAGFDYQLIRRENPCLKKQPFSSEQEYMVTETNAFSAMKGSPETIVNLSHLPKADEAEVLNKAHNLAKQGLRVLGFAKSTAEGNTQYLGLVGMYDPPRGEAAKTIARLREGQIKVVMITGDHPDTALSIAGQVGIEITQESLVTGRELAQMEGEERMAKVEQATVFSRVSPDQKRQIVAELQGAGHIVAMIGDGINDSPAIRRADVGISMGTKGVTVAQQASDMILTAGDLSEVVSTIEHGRNAYNNIGKVISYLLTSNAGEIALMLGGSLSGMGMPLLPAQLLWINLLGDGPPALALCLERGDGKAMQNGPPRRDGQLLTADRKKRILLKGTRMGLSTLALYALSVFQGTPLDTARTRSLVSLGMQQVFHLFESRTIDSRFPAIPNPAAQKTAWLSLGLLGASVYFPFLNRFFNLVPLALTEWGVSLAFALVGSHPLVSNGKHGRN